MFPQGDHEPLNSGPLLKCAMEFERSKNILLGCGNILTFFLDGNMMIFYPFLDEVTMCPRTTSFSCSARHT